MEDEFWCPLSEYDSAGRLLIITGGIGDGRGHQGVDLGRIGGISIGDPLRMPKPGRIAGLLNDGPFIPPNRHTAGINVHILCDDGTRYKFFHCQKWRDGLTIGQHLKRGEIFAYVGNTGTIAAHSHEEEHVGNFSNWSPHILTCIQGAIAAGRFADQYGLDPVPETPNDHPQPQPPPPPEDDMPFSKQELFDINKEAALAAIRDDRRQGKYLARDEVSTGIYMVDEANNKRMHIDTPGQVVWFEDVFRITGRGDIDPNNTSSAWPAGKPRINDDGASLSTIPVVDWDQTD